MRMSSVLLVACCQMVLLVLYTVIPCSRVDEDARHIAASAASLAGAEHGGGKVKSLAMFIQFSPFEKRAKLFLILGVARERVLWRSEGRSGLGEEVLEVNADGGLAELVASRGGACYASRRDSIHEVSEAQSRMGDW